MGVILGQRISYSRAERRSDAAVHIAGVSFALLAVPALLALTLMTRTDTPVVVGAAIYGASLVAMLLFSALYNIFDGSRATPILRRLDHSAIYLKIAGTYTPFTLIAGGPGVWLLVGLWGAALAGVCLKLAAPLRFRGFAIVLYLAMGWAGVFAGEAFTGALSRPVLALILTGGILYTVGVAFFLWTRLRFHNTIWHVFVLVASGFLFAAVALHIAAGA